MNAKIKTYLGFSIRSKSVLFGTDIICSSKKRPKLVLYDTTLAENSQKKLREHCDERNIKVLAQGGLPELLSKKNTLAVGIMNEHLAAAIETEWEKEKANEYGKSE